MFLDLSFFLLIYFWSYSKILIFKMSKTGDYEAVKKDIKALLHQPEYDDGSAGPVLVRLAWYVVP